MRAARALDDRRGVRERRRGTGNCRGDGRAQATRFRRGRLHAGASYASPCRWWPAH